MKWLLLAILTVIYAAVAQAQGAELSIGDQAPPITVAHWLGDEPVHVEQGTVYILTFWASWSDAGRASLAVLSRIQQGAKPTDVRVIAITTEPRGRVKAYLDRRGESLGVAVACDDKRTTYRAYVEATAEHDVPIAFVIDREQRLAWIGHPLDGLEAAVAHIAAGEWDIEAHRTARVLLFQARDAAAAGETDRLLGLLDRIARISDVYASHGLHRVAILAGELGRYEDAWQAGRDLIERCPDRADVCRGLAWFILDTNDLAERDLQLALAAAQTANDATGSRDPIVLATLARAHFTLGAVDKAVQTQALAVKCAEEAANASLAAHLREALDVYTAASEEPTDDG
ncbi:MAG: TlpA family protein disulfide reductase [Phycisphaerales bacterium]|nr:TlpA family protein disulfide reductase [Phycisphaerales bacterium]